MPTYREKDYEDMASRVVDRLLTQGTKLADAAVQEAMQGALNPDQIERLVQAANTMAFLRLMEARKSDGAPDMTHEFDPASTSQVLQSIIGQAHAPADQRVLPQDQAFEQDLPDEMSARRMPARGDEAFAQDKAPAQDVQRKSEKEALVRVARLRKLADYMEDQVRQASLSFEESLEALTQLFKKAHLPLTIETFEKDAMSIDASPYGLTVINHFRVARGLPAMPLTISMEKQAALVDRHVVTESEATRLYERLVATAKNASRMKEGALKARSKCA